MSWPFIILVKHVIFIRNYYEQGTISLLLFSKVIISISTRYINMPNICIAEARRRVLNLRCSLRRKMKMLENLLKHLTDVQRANDIAGEFNIGFRQQIFAQDAAVPDWLRVIAHDVPGAPALVVAPEAALEELLAAPEAGAEVEAGAEDEEM